MEQQYNNFKGSTKIIKKERRAACCYLVATVPWFKKLGFVIFHLVLCAVPGNLAVNFKVYYI